MTTFHDVCLCLAQLQEKVGRKKMFYPEASVLKQEWDGANTGDQVQFGRRLKTLLEGKDFPFLCEVLKSAPFSSAIEEEMEHTAGKIVVGRRESLWAFLKVDDYNLQRKEELIAASVGEANRLLKGTGLQDHISIRVFFEEYFESQDFRHLGKLMAERTALGQLKSLYRRFKFHFNESDIVNPVGLCNGFQGFLSEIRDRSPIAPLGVYWTLRGRSFSWLLKQMNQVQLLRHEGTTVAYDPRIHWSINVGGVSESWDLWICPMFSNDKGIAAYRVFAKRGDEERIEIFVAPNEHLSSHHWRVQHILDEVADWE